jgi:hypothetical protein
MKHAAGRLWVQRRDAGGTYFACGHQSITIA